MNCIVCHHGHTRPGTTTVTFRRDGQTVVVNEVPAEVCENCGGAYVAEDVTNQVLAIELGIRGSVSRRRRMFTTAGTPAPCGPVGLFAGVSVTSIAPSSGRT
jgi:YgiT-type zinc finger domain-containing protein